MSVWGDVGAQHAAPIHRANTATVHLGDTAPLVDVLYASCALPLYFPPQTIGGRRLGEGGLRAVLGLDAARRVPADLVVAVDVGPGFDEPPATKQAGIPPLVRAQDRKSTRLNSSHQIISYAVFCLKKKKQAQT